MVNSPITQPYQGGASAAKRRTGRVIRPGDIGLSSPTGRRQSQDKSPPPLSGPRLRSPNSLVGSMRSRQSSVEAVSYDAEAMIDADDSSQKSFLVVPKHSYKLPAGGEVDDDDIDDDLEDDPEYQERYGTGDSRSSRATAPVEPDKGAVKKFVEDLEDTVSLDSSSGRLSRKSSKKYTSAASRSSSPQRNKSPSKSIASPKHKQKTAGMSENSSLITFVGRRAGVKNIKKSLVDTFDKASEVLPKQGNMYSICEKYDTYVKGGLYPLLHISKDGSTIRKIRKDEEVLESDTLGEQLVVDQALYKEVASIRSPEDLPDTESVLTVAAFRSVDTQPNDQLISNWKSWTGARAYMVDIMEAGLQCKTMSFYRRELPLLYEDDHKGFYYVLICEIMIREPSDEGLITDVLQRFRVERWFGYQTIYKMYKH